MSFKQLGDRRGGGRLGGKRWFGIIFDVLDEFKDTDVSFICDIHS